MNLFDVSAALLTLAAVFNYLNYRYLKLPTTIGIMAMALGLSLLIVGAGMFSPAVTEGGQVLLGQIDFNEALMHGMLGLLLFAGALHVDLGDLTAQKGVIAVLATVGVLASTAITAGLIYLALPLVGLELDPILCLLFGALIAPTDPIAVLGILKKLAAPKALETKITGESLFNDGVGVVVFLALLGVAGLTHGHAEVTAGEVARLFVQEAFGGAAFGLVLGLGAYAMLRTVDDYQVEILISLALVMGGYALATALHLSGPIAMVVAGLLIGNHGRAFAMSASTREHLDTFWELVDEILNAVLFVLIGLEMLVLTLSGRYLLAGVLAIPITLFARFLAVGAPISLLGMQRRFTPHAVKVLTWGGLRGGISVALALWLHRLLGPERQEARDLILVMTYVVVVFSILVQGLTIGPLMGRLGVIGRLPLAGEGGPVDGSPAGESPAAEDEPPPAT